jgi:hypothetical protein
MFVDYVGHGFVCFKIVEIKLGKKVVGVPVHFPVSGGLYMYNNQDGIGEIVCVAHKETATPEKLIVFRFGNLDYPTSSIGSRVGRLLPAHFDYHHTTNAHMAATIKACNTPLLLTQQTQRNVNTDGYLPPIGMDFLNFGTGTADPAMTGAVVELQQLAYSLLQKNLEQQTTIENVVQRARRSEVDPNENILDSGFMRTMLPPNTGVAQAEYPRMPSSLDVAYGIYMSKVDNEFGLQTTLSRGGYTRTPETTKQILDQGVLREYQLDMNKLLGCIFAEMVKAGGVHPHSHPLTFHLGPPALSVEQAVQFMQVGVLSNSECRDFLREVLQVPLADVPSDEDGAEGLQENPDDSKVDRKKAEPKKRKAREGESRSEAKSADKSKNASKRDAPRKNTEDQSRTKSVTGTDSEDEVDTIDIPSTKQEKRTHRKKKEATGSQSEGSDTDTDKNGNKTPSQAAKESREAGSVKGKSGESSEESADSSSETPKPRKKSRTKEKPPGKDKSEDASASASTGEKKPGTDAADGAKPDEKKDKDASAAGKEESPSRDRDAAAEKKKKKKKKKQEAATKKGESTKSPPSSSGGSDTESSSDEDKGAGRRRKPATKKADKKDAEGPVKKTVKAAFALPVYGNQAGEQGDPTYGEYGEPRFVGDPMDCEIEWIGQGGL